MMKIATFNANSLRARLQIVLDWLAKESPDILSVQETKVQDKDFPLKDLEGCGYNIVYRGQKSYNGVAIFSKEPIEVLRFGLPGEPADEARMIAAKIGQITVINTYIPQGFEIDSEKYQYKLAWFNRLGEYFKNNFKPSDKVIWLGDLNVAPEAIDLHSPKTHKNNVCFNPELTEHFYSICKWGFTDLFRMHCTAGGHYTFWDYRAPNALKNNTGWRLDYIMATEALAKNCKACHIDITPRKLSRPSDHTFLIAEFD